MTDLTKLAPCEVWTEFEAITRVPRPSKKEEKIRDYLVGWAKEHGLEYRCDATGNVVIRKPATTGYEGRPTVILQSHMDMVCETAPDCTKDMACEGLDLFVDGDTIGARGTTLGGDDGIAVAYALAVLDAKDIPHPALEVVLTVCEEVGLLGASAMDFSDLEGRMLVNIDSEEEGVLTAGCAGGRRVECHLPIAREGGHRGACGRALRHRDSQRPRQRHRSAGALPDPAV